MGYRILGRTEELLGGYGARRGLEGPFIKGANRVVYYDPREGAYWDPRTDFYLSQDEVDELDRQLLEMMSR